MGNVCCGIPTRPLKVYNRQSSTKYQSSEDALEDNYHTVSVSKNVCRELGDVKRLGKCFCSQTILCLDGELVGKFRRFLRSFYFRRTALRWNSPRGDLTQTERWTAYGPPGPEARESDNSERHQRYRGAKYICIGCKAVHFP